MNRRIIVALDGMTGIEARHMMSTLRGEVDIFKVGFEMIARQEAGEVVAAANAHGASIFWDMKLHDIPATVAKTAAIIAQKVGVGMLNVHCSGSPKMMTAAREAVDPSWDVKLLGVTVLTSLDYDDLVEIGMIQDDPNRSTDPEWRDEQIQAKVLHLARLAQDSGLDGVVASPKETMAIRALCGPDFTIVTPGIRPIGSQKNDQVRTMNETEAILAGSDYLVIGRPITQPESGTPLEAAKRINDNIAHALEVRK